MIRAYNRKELLLGIGSLILSLFGFVCAFLFFRYVPAYVFYSFGVKVAEVWFSCGAMGALLLICACGYVRWKGKGGFYSYYDSAVYHNLDPSTGGANVVDLYTHRVTAPAYVLGQVFLAGPLMFLGAITHFRNRIAPDPLLEDSLNEKLAELRSINSWQPLSAHPGHEDLILLLAKIGRIDFSTTRGPRIRAYPETPDERLSDYD